MFPALAVAHELRARGHQTLFVGTREGMESQAGSTSRIRNRVYTHWRLEPGGLEKAIQNSVAIADQYLAAALTLIRRWKAGRAIQHGRLRGWTGRCWPVMRHLPLIIMEPNAIPGFANRRLANKVYRALVGFETTARYFPGRPDGSDRSSHSRRHFSP